MCRSAFVGVARFTCTEEYCSRIRPTRRGRSMCPVRGSCRRCGSGTPLLRGWRFPESRFRRPTIATGFARRTAWLGRWLLWAAAQNPKGALWLGKLPLRPIGRRPPRYPEKSRIYLGSWGCHHRPHLHGPKCGRNRPSVKNPVFDAIKWVLRP